MCVIGLNTVPLTKREIYSEAEMMKFHASNYIIL